MREDLRRQTKIRAPAQDPKSERLGKAAGRIRIWTFICIVPCLLFVPFVYLTQLRGQKPSVPGAVLKEPISMGPQEVGIQSATTTRESHTEGLETYRNDTYGFAFEYPRTWGKVEVEDASAGDQTVNPVGLKRPDTGKIFVGKFSRNVGCGFGGITPNYTYGAEGPLIISAGWTDQNGHYYTLWPEPSISRLVSGRGPDELLPKRIVKIASGTAQALILETPIKDLDGTVMDTVLKADINLPGPIFRGMALGCSLSPYETLEKISDNRRGVDAMLRNYRYTR